MKRIALILGIAAALSVGVMADAESAKAAGGSMSASLSISPAGDGLYNAVVYSKPGRKGTCPICGGKQVAAL